MAKFSKICSFFLFLALVLILNINTLLFALIVASNAVFCLCVTALYARISYWYSTQFDILSCIYDLDAVSDPDGENQQRKLHRYIWNIN